MPEYGILSVTARTSSDGVTTQDTFLESLTVTGSTIERASPSVPAAKSGTLSTRTDNDTGVVAVASGHGFTTGNKIDLFWSGGRRRQMDATVSGDNVTLDGGTGDNLPAQSTAVTGMVATEVEFTVTGDDVIMLGVLSPVPGFIVFVDNDPEAPAEIAAATYEIEDSASPGRSWVSGGSGTNPLAELVTSKVLFSHGSTAAQVMKAVAVAS